MPNVAGIQLRNSGSGRPRTVDEGQRQFRHQRCEAYRAENIDGLRLDYNLFIHGRRVAHALGAGDVVIWMYASGPSEYDAWPAATAKYVPIRERR